MALARALLSTWRVLLLTEPGKSHIARWGQVTAALNEGADFEVRLRFDEGSEVLVDLPEREFNLRGSAPGDTTPNAVAPDDVHPLR